jgi:hypothetical protein
VQVLDPELGGLKPFCSVGGSSNVETIDHQHVDVVFQATDNSCSTLFYNVKHLTETATL